MAELKAALLNIFISTMNQMPMRDVNDKNTENYRPVLVSLSSVSFSSLFWFSGLQLSSTQLFSRNLTSEKALINPPYTSCPAPNGGQRLTGEHSGAFNS